MNTSGVPGDMQVECLFRKREGNGGRLSNTSGTRPKVGNSSPKGGVILHIQFTGKSLTARLRMDLRPIR